MRYSNDQCLAKQADNSLCKATLFGILEGELTQCDECRGSGRSSNKVCERCTGFGVMFIGKR